MNIRITSTPAGEAPEEVRAAWVGLVFPVLGGPGPTTVRGFGVLSGPRSRLMAVVHRILGRRKRSSGFRVDAATAFAQLAAHSPEAIEWWRTNTPHLFRLRVFLHFDEEACTIEPE